MAHEVEQMAYVGAKPWHGLGNELSQFAPLEVWLQEAGLDWTVSKRPVMFHAPDPRIQTEHPGGSLVETFKDKFVLARDTDNKPYAVVSSRYKPVQPGQIIEFFRDLIKDFGMTIETAGSLRDGQRVWALAKTGDAHKVMGVDQVDGYLMLATSYDLSFSTLAQFTSVRVVCNNTLQQSFKNHSSRVSIPHFRDFNADAVKNELGIGRQQWEAFTMSLDALAKINLDVVKVNEVLRQVFPVTNRPEIDSVNNGHVNNIIDLFSGKAIGSDIAGATGWGLVNATTEYLDQRRRARSASNRLDSAWFGDSFNIKQSVFDETLKLAA